MSELNTEACLWRKQLAGELCKVYKSHEKVKLIILTGSCAKGTADEYSDIDIVVFWDEIDYQWLENNPLKDTSGERRLFRNLPDKESSLECYYYHTLKADFGHITIKQWEVETNQVVKDFQPDSDTQKSIFSFLTARALYGEELFKQQLSRLEVYPEALSTAQVRKHLGSFSEGCLEYQGLARNDMLFVYDAICKTMTDQLELLAGINRIYSPFSEPRHLKDILPLLRIKPIDFDQRFNSILQGDIEKGLDTLKQLKREILDLIEIHFPDIPVNRIKWFRDNMKVEACYQKPLIYGNNHNVIL